MNAEIQDPLKYLQDATEDGIRDTQARETEQSADFNDMVGQAFILALLMLANQSRHSGERKGELNLSEVCSNPRGFTHVFVDALKERFVTAGILVKEERRAVLRQDTHGDSLPFDGVYRPWFIAAWPSGS